MKQIKKILLVVTIMGSLATTLYSCKSGPKDSELTTQAQAVLPEGITVTIKNGVATLAGEFNDDIAKQSAESSLKTIPGIKSVQDNATVKPVEISTDEVLKTKINDVIKDYAGVTIDINDGVVTLNGDLKREDLPKLMQAISILQPKRIEQKLNLK